jgi:polysaccharide export outer membrane protein
MYLAPVRECRCNWGRLVDSGGNILFPQAFRFSGLAIGFAAYVLAASGIVSGAQADAAMPKSNGSSAAPADSPAKPAKKDNKNNKKNDSPPPPTGMNSTVADSDPDTYHIGVEDELQISVWREPDLSGTSVVRPDGKITLPVINEVYVVGLKTDELQALLSEKLKTIVNEPQVTVIVRQIRSRKVYLFGSIQHQGAFTLNGRKTILELIADGGGFSPFAKINGLYILRNVSGKQVRIPFNYKKAIAGHAENPVLQPGDMVIVP